MEEGFAKSLILKGKDESERIGYIKLPKFYADFTPQGATSCAVDVAKEIEKLKAEKVSGIILDLRNNGGGSLRDVVQMGGLFIENGPIVQVKSRTGRPDVMEDLDSRVQWNGPFVIMQNGFSASASEILAAAMQDYGRAIIVGSKSSYGKGTVQRFYPIDDSQTQPYGDVKITMQKFFRINGGSTQLRGVTPDIILPDNYNLIETGEREEKSALPWTEIDPSQFSQNVYHISKIEKLKAASAARVQKNETFQKVEKNAMRLKKSEEQTSLPLQKGKFKEYDARVEAESKEFEDMFKPIDEFQFENLSVDLAHIQADTSRTARNEDWLKNVKKDIQLFESLQIMRDLIKIDGVAQKN
jgi:carboxyl-terminal processing protease